MRGALEPIPGVTRVDIVARQKDFTVHYDPAKATVEQMLTALRSAGEAAQVKN